MAFREARINANLSVAEVTKALGVSDATVYMWETGKMLPKASRLIEVAKLYKTTIDKLLDKGMDETVCK